MLAGKIQKQISMNKEDKEPTITSILQIYRRPQYFQEQLEAIQNQTIKSDKIIVVNNEGGLSEEETSQIKLPENVQYVYANPNLKYHLRFAIGLLTDTDYLAFYDDDTIPNNRWVENCLNTIDRYNCICGTNGRIVDRANNTQYGEGWGNPKDVAVEVDLVGHAWLFKKEHLKYMWYDDILEFNNGEDIQLSANAQRFGNIPTYVPPHPINDKSLWGSDPEKAMKYGCDSNASWMIRSTHNSERYALFDKYVERGWKPILER